MRYLCRIDRTAGPVIATDGGELLKVTANCDAMLPLPLGQRMSSRYRHCLPDRDWSVVKVNDRVRPKKSD